MNFVLWSTGKAMGEYKMKWGRQTFLHLDYADDLSIPGESVGKVNKLLNVL